MGWFGRKKSDGIERGRYRRPRAAEAPEGWVAAQAVVDSCQSKRTSLKSMSSGSTDYVHKTTTTYEVLDDQGAPLAITVEAKLFGSDKPRVGGRLVIAYDPQERSEAVILVSEADYAANLKAYVRSAVHEGLEAPCEVMTAAQTGRVSAPDRPPVRATLSKRTAQKLAAQAAAAQPNPAPETKLTLRVHPKDSEPFEISTTLWDRDFGFEPGLRGVLFYHPEEPAKGYPLFPTVQQRAADDDAVLHARDTFVQQLG